MEHPHGHEPPPPSAALVKDPVCGMTVDPTTAKGGRVKHGGREYAFCSPKCRDKFLADPARYVATAQISREPGAVKAVPPTGATYLCPMHPEVRSAKPGSCPECGMAREPISPVQAATATQWTCPMHPEIVRDAPGTCPICGMALEPRTITAESVEDPELRDMKRRLLAATGFTIPLLAIAMSELFAPAWPSGRTRTYVELALAAPVCLWSAWPFYVRAVQSLARKRLNMFTLIGLGVSVAFGYSVIATLFPGMFPPGFRDEAGQVAVYFEAAAVTSSTSRVIAISSMWPRYRTSRSSWRMDSGSRGLIHRTSSRSSNPV